MTSRRFYQPNELAEAKKTDAWRIIQYGKFNVYYLPNLDGGGVGFAPDFLAIVGEKFGKVRRVCEFGSGPGFIGFALLASGLCERLCLIDISRPAIKCCRRLLGRMGLSLW